MFRICAELSREIESISEQDENPQYLDDALNILIRMLDDSTEEERMSKETSFFCITIIEVLRKLLKKYRKKVKSANLKSRFSELIFNLSTLLKEHQIVYKITQLQEKTPHTLQTEYLSLLIDIIKVWKLGEPMDDEFDDFVECMSDNIVELARNIGSAQISVVRKCLQLTHLLLKWNPDHELIDSILCQLRSYGEFLFEIGKDGGLDKVFDPDMTNFYHHTRTDLQHQFDAESIKLYIKIHVEALFQVLDDVANERMNTTTEMLMLDRLQQYSPMYQAILQDPDFTTKLFRTFGNDDSDTIWILFTFQRYQSIRTSLTIQWREFLNKITPNVTIHGVALKFFETLAYDYEILLDFLISAETCELFLTFLVRYLKSFLVPDCFIEFIETVDGDALVQIHSMIENLEASIKSSLKSNVFPYNATPLVNRLTAVRKLIYAELKK
ncbi:hypothetical protein K7432_009659 [Basidiobolus ranarum]